MSSTLGETATPLGSPDVAPEPGPDSFYEPGRPRLGGIAHPIRFSDTQTAVLNAVADTMIPPSGGFPAPSEVHVVSFASRYITPSGYKTKHFPMADADDRRTCGALRRIHFEALPRHHESEDDAEQPRGTQYVM